MTVYEHAMLGATIALAAGTRRRHGWGIVGTAALAAALPDADGLSILFGAEAYSRIHRVWAHNILVVSLLGLVTGAGGYGLSLSGRLTRFARPVPAKSTPPAPASVFSFHGLAVWMCVGLLASLSHLPADLVYAGAPGYTTWPVPLLWPFSAQGWALPVVPWGDLGVTLIFVAEMFALYRWTSHARLIAWTTLAAVLAYIGIWWLAARGVTPSST